MTDCCSAASPAAEGRARYPPLLALRGALKVTGARIRVDRAGFRFLPAGPRFLPAARHHHRLLHPAAAVRVACFLLLIIPVIN